MEVDAQRPIFVNIETMRSRKLRNNLRRERDELDRTLVHVEFVEPELPATAWAHD